jgi:hypothetical protein
LSVDRIPLQPQGSTIRGSRSMPAWSPPASSGTRGWCASRRRRLRRHRATRRCEGPRRPRSGSLGILPRPCGIFRRPSGAERVRSRPLIGALRPGLGQPVARHRVRSATARADALAERSITGKPVIRRNRTETTPFPVGGERVSRLRCWGGSLRLGSSESRHSFQRPTLKSSPREVHELPTESLSDALPQVASVSSDRRAQGTLGTAGVRVIENASGTSGSRRGNGQNCLIKRGGRPLGRGDSPRDGGAWRSEQS